MTVIEIAMFWSMEIAAVSGTGICTSMIVVALDISNLKWDRLVEWISSSIFSNWKWLVVCIGFVRILDWCMNESIYVGYIMHECLDVWEVISNKLWFWVVGKSICRGGILRRKYDFFSKNEAYRNFWKQFVWRITYRWKAKRTENLLSGTCGIV